MDTIFNSEVKFVWTKKNNKNIQNEFTKHK